MNLKSHFLASRLSPTRERALRIGLLEKKTGGHVTLMVISASFLSLAGTASAASIQIHGSMTGYVANGGIPSIGIESGYTFQGSLRGSGSSGALDSYSMGRFNMMETPGQITLNIDAEQVAAIPTRPSTDFKVVYFSVGLRIEAFATTRYDLTGVYSFLSELPGSEMDMSLFVQEVATGRLFNDVHLVVAGAGQERIIEIGGSEGAPSDILVDDFSGVFQAGQHYRMELHLSFANPFEAVAIGKTLQSFRFHFVQAPEPASMLLAGGWLPLLLAHRCRQRFKGT